MAEVAHYPGLSALERVRERLDGATVLVTGGSRGIGRACAEEALQAGARVVVAARGADALRQTAAALGEEFGHERVLAVPADVGAEGEVASLIAAAEMRFGRIDALIHAAAILGPIGPTLDVPPDAWFAALRANLFGTYLVTRAVARAMRARGGGRIVLLSGGGATSPFPRFTAYAASKVAVVRLAESLAVELAPHGIRINCLAPGFVATAMHDETLEAGELAGVDYLERTRAELASGGVPAELAARAALFLLSDRAEGITGRLISAPWDEWWKLPEHRDEVTEGDLFTLRRIVPRDRGGEWE